MPNINTLLREARESKHLTIKDASKALKLRERHIRMLEDGQLTELSKEIYLKGFLKTYTAWLNIDGDEILSKINHEKKKIAPQQGTVPTISLDLSYISQLARRPGVSVFFISAIFAVAVYVFWYDSHRNVTGADMAGALEHVAEHQTNVKYSNIKEEYLGKELIFFPHANVGLKVMDTNTGSEKLNNLADGDVFFLKIDENTVITSDSPGSIEVFIDNNGQQESIGTLDKVIVDQP